MKEKRVTIKKTKEVHFVIPLTLTHPPGTYIIAICGLVHNAYQSDRLDESLKQ